MTYLDIYDISGSGRGQDFINGIINGIKKNKFSILFSIFIICIIIIALLVAGVIPTLKPCKSKEQPIEASNSEQVEQPNSEQVEQPNPDAEPVIPNPDAEPVIPNPDAEPVIPKPDAEPSNNTGGADTTGAGSGFANMEPFTNDLPYELAGDKLSLNPDMDYNDFLQNMSLDQEVIKQHKQYVTDRNKVTSTASFAPARSDNQDIVTTWGLSKPTYVPIDSSARNVPSQDPEQGSKPVRLQWK